MEARGVGTRPASVKEFKASVGYVRFYFQKHAERMMVIKEESRRKSSMCMSIYLNIYVHHIQVIPTKVRADTGSPGTRATGGWEWPCGCRESNMDPVEEQLVFLKNKPSLQFATYLF